MPQDETFDYDKTIPDYKNIDTSKHDEMQGINAARENLSLSPEELKERFMKAPIAFMEFARINPEEELSENVQDAVRGLNAEVEPVVSKDAFSRLDSLNAPKAKELFKNLAASQFGVDNIEKLTNAQVNQLMQNDELKAMNEQNIGDDAAYLHKMTEAFADRDKLERYNATRENNLNRIWAEVEPLTISKAQSLVREDAKQKEGQAEQTATPKYTAPGITTEVYPNISIDPSNKSAFEYNENAPAANSTFSVEAPTNDPGLSIDIKGKNDDTPTMSFDGNLENSDFIYNAEKGANTAPITVNGNILNEPSTTVGGKIPQNQEEASAAQNAAIGSAQKASNIDFAAGFKFSKEARDKVAANNKNASFWGAGGIMEQFVSAKSPEDAFQGLFLNMLLYLPALAAKMAELKLAEMKERNKYIKERRNAYEDQIAQMKGLGATDRMRALHQDFIKTGGDMAALAGEIREKDPKLLKDLGIEFDKDGMAKDITDKQKEALAKAVFTERYKELYNGILPSQDKLKEMWNAHKIMMETGMYAKIQPDSKQTAAQDAPAAAPAQAEAAQVVQPATTVIAAQEATTPTPDQTESTTNPPATEKDQAKPTTPPIADQAQTQTAEGKVETPPKAEQIDTNNLSVAPQIFGNNSFEVTKDKMFTIDNKPLDNRPRMNLKDAHKLSLSITTPDALKADLSAFSSTVNGLISQEKKIENDRAALALAFAPKTATNQNLGNIRVGAERT